MEVMHEYQLITYMEDLPEPTKWEVLSEEDKVRTVHRRLDRIVRNLPDRLAQLPPGDWEAMSHSHAIYGRTLIVSFLLRH